MESRGPTLALSIAIPARTSKKGRLPILRLSGVLPTPWLPEQNRDTRLLIKDGLFAVPLEQVWDALDLHQVRFGFILCRPLKALHQPPGTHNADNFTKCGRKF